MPAALSYWLLATGYWIRTGYWLLDGIGIDGIDRRRRYKEVSLELDQYLFQY